MSIETFYSDISSDPLISNDRNISFPELSELSKKLGIKYSPDIPNQNPGGVKISGNDDLLKQALIADRLSNKVDDPSIDKEDDKATYAFDLSRERELIQKYGEAYWPDFRTNFQTYINEIYGHLRKTEYSMDLIQNNQGFWEIYLARAGDLIRAKESFNVSAQDLTLPDWYRYRCSRDVTWAEATEKIINSQVDVTRLVEFSHAPFHIDEEDREKIGFGRQSFLRVHKLSDLTGKGRKRIHTTAIRHYLALDEQCNIFNNLTGVVLENSLLGFSEVLNPAVTIGEIESKIDALYDKTPSERKIIPKKEDLIQLTQEQAQVHHEKTKVWLKGIFLMMKDSSFKEDEIESEFIALKLTLRDIVYGEDINISWVDSLTPEGFLTRAYKNHKQLQDRKKIEDGKEGSDCPGKSRFRKREVIQMRPASQKAYFATPEADKPDFYDICPLCFLEGIEIVIDQVVKIGQPFKCCHRVRLC